VLQKAISAGLPLAHDKVDMRQFVTLAHEGFADENSIDL